MIEKRDIELRRYECDVPGCIRWQEVADILGDANGPRDWNYVKLGNGDGLVLCPAHAEYKPIIRTVLLALERRDAEITEVGED